jgi:hypothetical protein
MKYLNAQQLAFILDIKKEDARFKMVNAWCKAKNVTNFIARTHNGKLDKDTDKYPEAMPIDILSVELNLPTLQNSVDDICNNYLTRPATKKYILCDLPEKIILKATEDGHKPKMAIPPALRSMLPPKQIEFIFQEWEKRYKEFRPEPVKEGIGNG